MPSTKRSGLSAMVGLGLVVGLLLVGGTLAISGGGILSSGGRLGVEATESAAPAAAQDDGGDVAPAGGEDSELPPAGSEGSPVVAAGTKTDFSCEDAAITDLSRRKWKLNRFVAGSRIEEGYDQVSFELSLDGKAKAKDATDVRLEWMDPGDVRSRYGAPDRVQGSRALVATFDGPVGIDVNQALDSLLLEREDVEQIRNIQMFEGTDGMVHAAIGLRSDSCARVEAKGWSKKAKAKAAKVLLQVERFDS